MNVTISENPLKSKVVWSDFNDTGLLSKDSESSVITRLIWVIDSFLYLVEIRGLVNGTIGGKSRN